MHFNQGVLGFHPCQVRKRRRPRNKQIITPEVIPEPQVVEEVVISVEEVEEVPDATEVVIVEADPPKKTLKDMTPEERRAFYKARAKKAKETREKKRLLKLSSQS
jgi:hypothetical protein